MLCAAWPLGCEEDSSPSTPDPGSATGVAGGGAGATGGAASGGGGDGGGGAAGGQPPGVEAEWGTDLGAPRSHCDARPLATGTVRYVATTGTDAGDCTSEASPCESVEYAWTQVQSGVGSTIYLRGGSYSGTQLDVHVNALRHVGASASEPIVIASYPGEWAVVSGGDGVFTFDHNRFLRLSCLEIQSFELRGVYAITSEDVELDHLVIHGVTGTDGGINPSGIQLNYDSTRFEVHHNHIYDVQRPVGGSGPVHNFMGVVVFDDNGVGDNHLHHNLVHDAGACLRLKHAAPSDKPANTIHHNVVARCSWALGGGDADNVFHHNIAFDTANGYVCSSDGAQPGALVHNNTFVEGSAGAVVLSFTAGDDPSTGTSVRFVNNLADVDTGVSFYPDVLSLDTIDYNLYRTGSFSWTADHASLDAWQAATGQDEHSSVSDPELTSPAALTSLADGIAAATPPAAGSVRAVICGGGQGGSMPSYLGAVPCEPEQ